ncbi:MAG: hypothetical protein WCQ20_06455 [Synechococcaceae cyanobacterium ELA739]
MPQLLHRPDAVRQAGEGVTPGLLNRLMPGLALFPQELAGVGVQLKGLADRLQNLLFLRIEGRLAAADHQERARAQGLPVGLQLQRVQSQAGGLAEGRLDQGFRCLNLQADGGLDAIAMQ